MKQAKILAVANELLLTLESSGLASEDWATVAEIVARISKSPYGAIDWTPNASNQMNDRDCSLAVSG